MADDIACTSTRDTCWCGLVHPDDLDPDVLAFLALSPVPSSYAFRGALDAQEREAITAHLKHAEPILVG